MKKKLIFFVMVMFLAFQPLSVNLGALAKEKNETTDCNSCSQQAPLQIEKNGFLNDSVVVNEVKQDLDIAENFTHSEYSREDFDRQNTEYMDYGKNKDGLMIPYKKNNESFDIRLLTTYDKTTGEVGEFIIMKSTLDVENNEINVTYATLNNEDMLGMTIEASTNKVIDKQVYFDENSEVSLLSTNSAKAGYWSDSWECLKNYWYDAPELTKQICSAACASVIFGGNVVGAVACASCLGSHVMVCLIH
ncbi:hypothetical protein [Lysinibacillus capsici]|uniref:hypothetical protein n=1 Tax=Lysinibacillus capsici TaxID=2115968 RepID=UPI0034E41A54